MALIGFVFSSVAGRSVFVTLCGYIGCVVLGAEGVGFVLYSGQRTACSVLGIARLGLIGFVFSGGAERDIVVTLCFIGSWGDFGVSEIGFVLYSGQRTACSVLDIARLGLFGFVFSIPAERDIVVTLCFIEGWGDFGVLEIGFVLRKKL